MKQAMTAARTTGPGFRARMIERVLTQFQTIPKEDLDYLLEKLDYYSEMAAMDDVESSVGAA